MSTIKHAFISEKIDDADTTLVRPSNWNADHVITGLVSAVNIVTDYGAVGDGVTDNTAAFQAAVDDFKGVGATIFVPRGTYKVTAQIDNDPATYSTGGYLHFIGEGSQDTPASIIQMTTAATSLFVGNFYSYDMKFTNIYLLGPSSGASGYGIYSLRNIHADGLRVSGFYDGIRIGDNSYYAKIVNSLFHANAHAGVLIDDDANNSSFFNCRFANNGYGFIRTGGGNGGEKHRVIACSFENNATAGIAYDGTSSTQEGSFSIRDSYFESNATSVLLGNSAPPHGVVIDGCWFVNSDSGWHIDIVRGDRVTITGNHFQPTFTRDVRQASGVTNVVLLNNLPGSTGGASYSLQPGAVVIDPADTATPSPVGTAASAGTAVGQSRTDHVHAAAAENVSIADAGSYWAGTSVEAALQEAGAAIAVSVSAGTSSEHAHVVSEAHLSDGSGTTYTLDQSFEAGSVIAWNVTSMARLGVSETLPDQVSVSSAGSSGDTITFDYAATLG